MLPKNIPSDINIELLLSYFERGSFKVNLKGLHKRNVYNDISDIEEKADGTLLVSVARNMPTIFSHRGTSYCLCSK